MNKKIFNKLNITGWTKYTGKNVKLATLETVNPTKSLFPIKTPLGNITGEINSHGYNTLDIVNQIAPDAELYTLPHGEPDITIRSLKYAIDNGINFIISSIAGVIDPEEKEWFAKAIDAGVTFICSAGNSKDKGVTGYAIYDEWISITGVDLKENKQNYASIGKEVDFASVGEPYIRHATIKNRWFTIPGTSFIQPIVSGMLCLVQQHYKDNYGFYLNQNQLIEYMIAHSKDLGEQGRDNIYGHGLFILPEVDKLEVKFKIGEPEYKLNGVTVPMDTEAIIHKERTLVPIRAISEIFGCEVSWDAETRTVIIKK
jgi:hypothetical protein